MSTSRGLYYQALVYPSMATEDVDARWSAAELGVEREEAAAYRDLATDLRARVSGGVEFDEYARVLYATDGSIYRARPAGVVYPRDVDDVRAAVDVATDHEVPILPRGAGSSLAGQTVGPGCVVLDMSRHFDDILEVRPDDPGLDSGALVVREIGRAHV